MGRVPSAVASTTTSTQESLKQRPPTGVQNQLPKSLCCQSGVLPLRFENGVIEDKVLDLSGSGVLCQGSGPFGIGGGDLAVVFAGNLGVAEAGVAGAYEGEGVAFTGETGLEREFRAEGFQGGSGREQLHVAGRGEGFVSILLVEGSAGGQFDDAGADVCLAVGGR